MEKIAHLLDHRATKVPAAKEIRIALSAAMYFKYSVAMYLE